VLSGGSATGDIVALYGAIAGGDMNNAVPGATKRDTARRADSNPERRKGRRWYAAVEGRIGRLTTKYLYPRETVMTEVSKRWSTPWRRQPENRPYTYSFTRNL
jgi:hypothetical protein